MKTKQQINKVLNNSFSFALIKKGIVTVCSIAFVSLLSRYLGPTLKGEYSTYMSCSSILVIILQMGFFKLYPYYKRNHPEESCKDVFFSISIFKAVIFGLVVLLFLGVFEKYKINTLFPITVLLNMLQGECLFLVLVDNIKYQNIISIVIYLLNVVDILALFLFAEPKVSYVFIVLIIRDVVAVVLSIIYMKYRLIISKRLLSTLTELLGNSIFPVIAALLVEMNYRVDVIFLNKLTDDYLVGLYATGVQLAEMAWMIPDVFKEVLFNKTAKSDSVDKVCFSLRIAITTVILCLIGIVLLGKPIIYLLFGEDYMSAYAVTMLIFIGVPFMAIFKVLNPLIQARGEWKIYIFTLLMAVLSNVVLNLIMIKMMGMPGAAVASIVSYSIAGVSMLIYFIKKFKVKIRDCIFINKEDVVRIRSFIKS